MRSRAPLVIAALVALLAVALAPVADGATPRQIKKRTRLLTFDTCAGLIDYAQKYQPRVANYYVGDGRAVDGVAGPPAPAPPSAPTTGGAEGGAGAGGDGAAPQPQGAPTAGDGAPDDTSQTNVQEQGVDV